MVAARNWPHNLCPSSVSFIPNIPSASGGVSMGGEEQFVISSVGRWKAIVGFYNHFRRDRSKVLAARAMIAFLKGKTNHVYIGPYDHGNSPGALLGGYSTNTEDEIPHSDNSLFSDGTGYSEGVTFATFYTASPSMGDLSAFVNLATGQEPQPGQYFGIGDDELYLIDGATFVGSPNVWEITFWPSLRADHDAYTEELNFDYPTCEMRLASDDGYTLDMDRLNASASQIELVEAL